MIELAARTSAAAIRSSGRPLVVARDPTLARHEDLPCAAHVPETNGTRRNGTDLVGPRGPDLPEPRLGEHPARVQVCEWR